MTQRFKDHWYIAVALIAIFAAGNGFGFVFGSKSARESSTSTPTVEVTSWADATLDKLESSLALSPEQFAKIRPDVEATAEKVIAARERTLLDYHLLLLSLHDELAEQLDPAQQELLKQSKLDLEKTIKKRFATLLDGDS